MKDESCCPAFLCMNGGEVLTLLFALAVAVWNIGVVWDKAERRIEERKHKFTKKES